MAVCCACLRPIIVFLTSQLSFLPSIFSPLTAHLFKLSKVLIEYCFNISKYIQIHTFKLNILLTHIQAQTFVHQPICYGVSLRNDDTPLLCAQFLEHIENIILSSFFILQLNAASIACFFLYFTVIEFHVLKTSLRHNKPLLPTHIHT